MMATPSTAPETIAMKRLVRDPEGVLVHPQCSICHEPLKPVRLKGCRHTFCLSDINEHLEQQEAICPECSHSITSAEDVVPVSHDVQNMIDAAPATCCHDASHIVQLDRLHKHETDECDARPVIYPNAGCETSIEKRDLPDSEPLKAETQPLNAFDPFQPKPEAPKDSDGGPHVAMNDQKALRYDTGRSLSHGHTATVFECHDRHSGRSVAMKIVPNVARGQSLTDTFHKVSKYLYREVALRHYLHQHGGHPNVLSADDMYYTLDDETDPTSAFTIHIVMPLMDTSAHHLLSNLVMSGVAPMLSKAAYLREVAVQVAFQMLLGLDYLHRVGIVHSDLKPENVLVCSGKSGVARSTTVKLTDMGLSREVVCSGTGPRWARTTGTLPYVPPEHLIFYRKKELHPSMDIWALGCVLYELLTERVLFHKLQLSYRTHWDGNVAIQQLEQLEHMFDVIGTPTEDDVRNLMTPSDQRSYLLDTIHRKPRPPQLRHLLRSHINASLECSDDDKDEWAALITSCLMYFPSQRPTARQLLLQHEPLFGRYGIELGLTMQPTQSLPPALNLDVPEDPMQLKACIRTLIDSYTAPS